MRNTICRKEKSCFFKPEYALLLLVIIFLSNAFEIDFPNKGTALRLIANASKTPSHSIIGVFQLIRFSKNIMSLLKCVTSCDKVWQRVTSCDNM